MIELRHGRVTLALHELREGEGTPLLLLHGLTGSSEDWRASVCRHYDRLPDWRGTVHALDLSGHGRSGRVRGGVYYPELFCADADTALAALGSAVLVGAGVSAYSAMLLAGGRPEQVPAAVLLPGAGLEGGGPQPGPEGLDRRIPRLLDREPADPEPPARGDWDPQVEACTEDIRPLEYARDFADGAQRLVFVEGGGAPPWWQAAQAASSSETAGSLTAALAALG